MNQDPVDEMKSIVKEILDKKSTITQKALERMSFMRECFIAVAPLFTIGFRLMLGRDPKLFLRYPSKYNGMVIGCEYVIKTGGNQNILIGYSAGYFQDDVDVVPQESNTKDATISFLFYRSSFDVVGRPDVNIITLKQRELVEEFSSIDFATNFIQNNIDFEEVMVKCMRTMRDSYKDVDIKTGDNNAFVNTLKDAVRALDV